MQGVAATATTTTAAAAATAKVARQDVEPQQGLECPRCGSTNTKFCYYNNYNLSQPRHFCKGCRRYWTKGGALRNIPVGGGSRKNSTKRSCSSSSSSSNPKRSTITTSATPPTNPTEPTTRFPKPDPISVVYPTVDPDHRMLDITGSFSSLLASNGQLGGLLEGFGGPPSASEMSLSVGAPGLDLQSSTDSSGNEHAPAIMGGSLLSSRGDLGCWTGGWTDLAIYSTPDLSFQ